MPVPVIYAYYKNIEQVRVRHTISYLLQCLPPFLDVGCGSKKISAAVNAVTVDINKKHRPNIIASTLHLPFRDGCFKTVSAFEVMEHLENGGMVLLELKRVSRNKVVLSVPNSLRYNIPFFPSKRRGFMSSDHKREYTTEELLQLISDADMHVTKLKGMGYCIPLPFLSLRIGFEIFPLIFPKFATYIYVECTKVRS